MLWRGDSKLLLCITILKDYSNQRGKCFIWFVFWPLFNIYFMDHLSVSGRKLEKIQVLKKVLSYIYYTTRWLVVKWESPKYPETISLHLVAVLELSIMLIYQITENHRYFNPQVQAPQFCTMRLFLSAFSMWRKQTYLTQAFHSCISFLVSVPLKVNFYWLA